jgi:hypothetical protein
VPVVPGDLQHATDHLGRQRVAGVRLTNAGQLRSSNHHWPFDQRSSQHIGPSGIYLACNATGGEINIGVRAEVE